MSHSGDTSTFAPPIQVKCDLTRGTIAAMKLNRAIIPALLGAVILTDATQVCARVRDPSAQMPFRPGIPMTGRADMRLQGTMQPAQPLQNRAPSGPWRVLTGIIAYTDPKQGFAMIGNSVKNTYLARPGDQLPDGSRIREIHPKQIVLESGGRLETVDLYEQEQSTRAVYAPIPLPLPQQAPPLPQQARWDEAELKQATTGEATPSHPPRSPEQPPGEPRPSDIRASSDTAASQVHSIDGPSSSDAQAQPQGPLSPTTQDPADEFGDDRRQRADNRRK